jgi:ribosome biogenesis GTPase A
MLDERKKSFAQVLRVLKGCHLAIEVVDARDIEGTRVTKLDRQFRSKVFIVASKSDMVQAKGTGTLERMPVVFFSARTRAGLEEIFSVIRSRAREKALLEIKVAVFGIPNVGKSSLINLLRGKHSSKTGFRPGITRGPQWVRIRSGILLLDTPGVVSLKETRNELALKSAVEAEALKDPELVAEGLIAKFSEEQNDSLLMHYSAKASEDPFEVLVEIAQNKGLLMKGGESNTYEAAKVVIRDFQKGKFTLRRLKENGIGSVQRSATRGRFPR